MKTQSRIASSLTTLSPALALALCLSAQAATEHWLGAGADQNWTTAANWSSPQQSYFNDVDFYDFGGSASLTDFSVNNVFPSATGVAQCPIYMLRMYPTNRNFTTMINSGVALYTGAGTGDLYVGGDTITASRGVANLQETITFEGAGALLAITGTLHVGQGLTNTTQTVPASTNYVTLNMSGLDNFAMMPSISGGTQIQGITVGNTASGTAASRFLLCGQIRSYSQGAIYLAKTNIILLGNDMEIGAMNTYSNSMPCPVYLGISNSILVGNNGAANGLVTVGSRGNTNAFMTFNPAFLGGAAPPVASFASPPAINGGRVTTFYVCRSDGGVIPAYGYADFTGGHVTIMASTMQLGYAGNAGLNALGVLTLDNGIVNVNNVNVGNQTVSSGGAGAGIINLNTNSAYATNATLQVNNILTLGAVAGALTAGTAGTLNLNGATLLASAITNGGGASAVNMTNSVWGGISALSTSVTNMTVAAFNGGGATNIVNITAITPFLGGSFPVRFHLIAAPSLNGASTLGLGSLPASYDPSHPYSGYLDTSSTPGLVDLVLTAGPATARVLTWSGTNAAGNPDGDWDVGLTADWLTNGVATSYNQLDVANFIDIASPAQTNLNLTTTLTPYSITVNNTASLYTFGGPGSIGSGDIGASATLTKQGAGTLILDNGAANTFTGGVTISGGVLQVGTNDSNGNLPAVPVVDNSVLAFDRVDNVTFGGAISGTGAVIEAGGGTLQLAAPNTFTGNVIATNNSTLQAGIAGAFGATNGTVIITSGSTLDPNGIHITRAVTVSGAGVNGEGAVVNSGGGLYDSVGGLTPTLTLAGDATLSFPTRWDLGSSTGAALSTGGQPYNLTLNGSGYFEWRDVRTDTNLANIYVPAGTLGYAGSSSAGNPTSSLVISSGAGLTFYNDDGFNATINKQVVVDDGGTVQNGGGTSTMSGPVVLTNVNGSGYCAFKVGSGTSLALNGPLSGNGILDLQTGGTLSLNGNSPAFTGGVLMYGGTLDLTGTVGCGITNEGNTTIEGTGAAAGTLDVAGGLIPGTPTTAGTLTVGGLVLEGGALLTNNLSSVQTVGQGINSFIQVNGNLTVNNNTIYVNPLALLANGSTYTLLACTGAVNGAFAGAATVQASSYTLTLTNVTTSSNTLVQLKVAGGQASQLVWNNATGNGEWDVQSSQNWSNVTTFAAQDYFYSFDSVVLNDSITSAANPTTSIDIGQGQVVIPTLLSNNSTTNYTISGAGKISGLAGIVKLGASTLTISTTNDFTGNVTIGGGTLKAGPSTSLGGPSSTNFVASGATLDLDYSLGAQPVVISGAGVGGIGALVNNDPSGTPVYDNPGGLLNVTLAGNATIGGSNRVDFGKISPSTGTVSSGGSNYSLTVVGTAYREWDNVIFDANFGNIYVMTTAGGAVGIKGLTTLGNPANTLAVFSNANVTLYEDSGNASDNVTLNKNILLYGGSTFQNGGGTNLILSPVALGTNNADICTLNIGGSSLTVSNVISGPGTLVKTGSSPLYLAAANTYTGSTVVTTGPLDLIGSGSISASTNISLAASQVLDVSARLDDTLALASGQTLQGSGTINGSLTVSSGATVAPGPTGAVGTLTITNLVSLSGTTMMKVNQTAHNQDRITAVTIGYGGTLSVTNLAGTLVPGSSFKLFSASSGYEGSFNAIVPSTPGPGLLWDSSQLNVSGTLGVLAAPPLFGSFAFSSGNIVFSGSNGIPNQPFYVLATTNLATPLTNWVVVATNAFDGNGNFSLTNTVGAGAPQQFFELSEAP